jgi:hypothetical protein
MARLRCAFCGASLTMKRARCGLCGWGAAYGPEGTGRRIVATAVAAVAVSLMLAYAVQHAALCR